MFHFLIDFHPGNQFFYCCQSFQSANQQATGCQRGRRQGRSLKIRPHPAGVGRACRCVSRSGSCRTFDFFRT